MEIWRDFKCHDDPQESENPSRGQILLSLSRDPEKKTVSVSVEKGKDIDTQLGKSPGFLEIMGGPKKSWRHSLLSCKNIGIVNVEKQLVLRFITF